MKRDLNGLTINDYERIEAVIRSHVDVLKSFVLTPWPPSIIEEIEFLADKCELAAKRLENAGSG